MTATDPTASPTSSPDERQKNKIPGCSRACAAVLLRSRMTMFRPPQSAGCRTCRVQVSFYLSRSHVVSYFRNGRRATLTDVPRRIFHRRDIEISKPKGEASNFVREQRGFREERKDKEVRALNPLIEPWPNLKDSGGATPCCRPLVRGAGGSESFASECRALPWASGGSNFQRARGASRVPGFNGSLVQGGLLG